MCLVCTANSAGMSQSRRVISYLNHNQISLPQAPNKKILGLRVGMHGVRREAHRPSRMIQPGIQLSGGWTKVPTREKYQLQPCLIFCPLQTLSILRTRQSRIPTLLDQPCSHYSKPGFPAHCVPIANLSSCNRYSREFSTHLHFS